MFSEKKKGKKPRLRAEQEKGLQRSSIWTTLNSALLKKPTW